MIFDWKTETHRYQRYFVNLGKISERKDFRSITELTVTLFVISFFAFVAIKPTFIIITGLTREIKDKQEISEKLQKKITSLVAAQEEYSLNENRFYLLDQALPLNPDFPTFILNVEREASNANLEIFSFKVEKIILKETVEKSETKTAPAKAVGPNVFDFEISVTGDYQNLKSFLGKIEQFRRIASIESISFGRVRRVEKEPSKLRLTIAGKLSFYEKARD